MMVPALLNIYCTIAIKYISATFIYAKNAHRNRTGERNQTRGYVITDDAYNR